MPLQDHQWPEGGMQVLMAAQPGQLPAWAADWRTLGSSLALHHVLQSCTSASSPMLVEIQLKPTQFLLPPADRHEVWQTQSLTDSWRDYPSGSFFGKCTKVHCIGSLIVILYKIIFYGFQERRNCWDATAGQYISRGSLPKSTMYEKSVIEILIA